MIQSTKRRTSLPLKWHGGKHYLAPQIVDMFPEHVHYVEPFFGGGAVLFAKSADQIVNHSELINDINGDLINFWEVLKNPRKFVQFCRIVEATPFSKPEWQRACAEQTDSSGVSRAVAFFIRFRQSRQGLGRDFATMSRSRTRRGMNEQTSSWLSAIDGLEAAHQRLKRVAILSEDAMTVIEREDSQSTFFYLDPPYLHETRSVKDCYEYEMLDKQHNALLDLLSSVKGKFLLSGYPSETYSRASAAFGWNKVEIAIDNKASSMKTKPKKLECLWSNY